MGQASPRRVTPERELAEIGIGNGNGNGTDAGLHSKAEEGFVSAGRALPHPAESRENAKVVDTCTSSFERG